MKRDKYNLDLIDTLNQQVGGLMRYLDGRLVRVLGYDFKVEAPYRWRYKLKYMDTGKEFYHAVKGAKVKGQGNKELFT